MLELQSADERCFKVVEMRYLAADGRRYRRRVDISLATVKRDWRKARAFLFDQLVMKERALRFEGRVLAHLDTWVDLGG